MSAHRVIAGATVATILAVLPVYLLGSMSVLMRPAIEITEFRLGIAVSLFFGISAVLAPFGGRLAERIGPTRALRAAILFTASSLAIIGAMAQAWGHVLAALAFAAVGNALAQPTSNLALSIGVLPGRRGVALGLKQSAGSLAAVLAGLAVPVLGLTLGWRAGFLVAAALAIAAVAVVAKQVRQRPKVEIGRLEARGQLLAFSLVAGFGVAAAFSIGSFYVATVVAQGWTPTTAGLALAAGGGLAVATQIGYGVWADRHRRGALRVLSGSFLVGSVGVSLVASAATDPLLVTGSILAFIGGMGWPGLFNLAVIARYPDAPGAATGVTTAGMFAGGSIGPFVVGWIMTRFGYPFAWGFLASSLLLAGAGTIALARWTSPPRSQGSRSRSADNVEEGHTHGNA